LVGDVDVRAALAAGDNNGVQSFTNVDIPGGGNNFVFGFIVLVGDVNVMTASFAADDSNGLQSFANVDIPGGGDNIVFGFAILVGDVDVMTASFAVGGINVDVRPVLAVRDNNGV